MTTKIPWKWITRNVEPTIEKWITTPCSVVLIRGIRRVGKSSSVERVARKKNLSFINIYIKTNDEVVCQEIQTKLGLSSIVKIWDVGIKIVESIKTGKIIILEEIQNASDTLQVSLQEGIDKMAKEFMFSYDDWSKAGSLFLMGSLPEIVDAMIESRRHALYQRVTAKITVLPFNTKELCYLFKYFQLDQSPQLMLSFHTIFGSLPYLYFVAYQANLLHSSVTSQDLLESFFTSDLQKDCKDAGSFYSYQFGSEMAHALKAVELKNKKSEQVKYIEEKLNISTDRAWEMLQTLNQRYGVIKPVFHPMKKLEIDRFKIVDPIFIIAHSMEYFYNREDTHKSLPPNYISKLEIIEGAHLELWVQEILEDRYLLLSTNIFPHPDFPPEFICIEHSVRYDNKTPGSNKSEKDNANNYEIDLVISFPKTKRITFCSCKRSRAQVSQINLKSHVEQFCKHFPNGVGDRLHISNPSEWKSQYVHIYCIEDSNSDIPPETGVYYFSLQSLLDDFFKQIHIDDSDPEN